MLEALRVIPKTNICWDSAHSDATQICPTQKKNVEGGAGYEILDLLATHRIMDMPKIQETFSLSYFAAATSAPMKYIQALAAEPPDRRSWHWPKPVLEKQTLVPPHGQLQSAAQESSTAWPFLFVYPRPWN